VLLSLSTLACAGVDNERRDDTALYLLVLEHVRSELDMDGTIAIHPLLALRPAQDASPRVPLTDFNAFDSVSVRTIIEAAPAGRYRVCATQPGGSCIVADQDVAVVLSEMFESGENDAAVQVNVLDARRGRDFRQRWVAWLRRGMAGWTVTTLERLD
jgi:hypothetical protein